MTEPFAFETTYDPIEAQERFAAAYRPPRGMPSADKVMLVGGVVGIAFLFSWYTFALGAALLAVCTFAFAMKNRAHDPKRVNRALNPGPLHVRLTDEGYTLAGPAFTTQATWQNITGFSESGDVFLLRTMNARSLFLSVAELKAAGLYERVKALAEARRNEFATLLKPVS